MRIPTNEEIKESSWWIARAIIFVIGIWLINPFIQSFKFNRDIRLAVGLFILGYIANELVNKIENYIKLRKQISEYKND